MPSSPTISRNNTSGFNTPWTARFVQSPSTASARSRIEATGVIGFDSDPAASVVPHRVPQVSRAPAAASNVNFGRGGHHNLVVVKTGTGGKVDISNELGSPRHPDAVGYFAPDPDRSTPRSHPIPRPSFAAPFQQASTTSASQHTESTRPRPASPRDDRPHSSRHPEGLVKRRRRCPASP
jgi:hypothetical protein